MRYLPLLGTAYLLLFYSFLQMDLMNPFGKELIRELNLNQGQFGLLASLFFYVDMFLIIPAGICLDRYGCKLTLCTALLLTFFGASIFALFPTFSTAILWRCLSGILGALSVIGPILLITSMLEKRLIASAISAFGLIAMSAGIIAQTPVTLMIQYFGMRITLLIDIVLGMVLFTLVLFTSQESARKQVNLREQGQMIKQMYRNKVNLNIALLASFINIPLFVLGAGWGSLYLENGHHLATGDTANMLSMVFIGNIIGALFFGYISCYVKNKLFLMLIGNFVCTISLIGLVADIARGIIFYYTILFFLGFATGAQVLAYALMIDLHPYALQGKATSVVSLFSVGLGAMMQMVCGYISIHHISILLMVCAVISSAMAVFLNFSIDRTGIISRKFVDKQR